MNSAIFPNIDKTYLLYTVFIILTIIELYNLEDFKCLSGDGGGKELVTLGFRSDEISPFPSAHYTGPIRIHYHYDESFLKQPDNKYIKDIIIPMVDKRLKSLFKSRYGLKYHNLKLRKLCIGYYEIIHKDIKCKNSCDTHCDGVDVPYKYFKKCNLDWYADKDGVGAQETDYIVVIHSKFKCNKESAKAKTCFLNEVDAPVGGVLFICPFIINSKVNAIVLRDLLLHQFFHLLGFIPYLHQFARDDKGKAKCQRDINMLPKNNYKPLDTCYQPGMIEIERQNYRYVKRKVILDTYSNILLDTVKHFFKCDTMRLTFATDIRKYLHFDELYFGNEMMSILPNPLLDKITKFSLEFMDTLGWYNIQYEEADDFDYLEFSNCNFVKYGLLKFAETNRGMVTSPYCDVPYLPGKVFSCHHYNYIQYCDLMLTNNFIHDNQYFKKLKGVKSGTAIYWSGTRSYMDRYPTFQMLFNFENKSFLCNDLASLNKSNNNNYVQSYYGNNSLCFNHELTKPPLSAYYGAACHKVAPLNDTAFILYYNNVDYECPYSSTVNIDLGYSLMEVDCGSVKIDKRKEVTKSPIIRPERNSSFLTYLHVNLTLILFFEIIYVPYDIF